MRRPLTVERAFGTLKRRFREHRHGTWALVKPLSSGGYVVIYSTVNSPPVRWFGAVVLGRSVLATVVHWRAHANPMRADYLRLRVFLRQPANASSRAKTGFLAKDDNAFSKYAIRPFGDQAPHRRMSEHARERGGQPWSSAAGEFEALNR